MRQQAIWCAAVWAPCWAPVANGQPVVINEIRIDQPGADDEEFVELLGPGGFPLDGLTYVVIGDHPATGSGTVEQASSLDGQSLQSDGRFVIGENPRVMGVPVDYEVTLNFENCDNVTHMLVSGFEGSVGDDLDQDDDCQLDRTPWKSVLDLIALIQEYNPPRTTECHFGPPIIGPDGWEGGNCKDFGFRFAPGHIFRCEATGEWLIGHFNTGQDTPGARNQCQGDTDCDDTVNVDDLVNVILAWGPCPASCPADMDGNLHVNVDDLVAVVLAWGPC